MAMAHPESRESYVSAMRLLAEGVEVDPDLNPEQLLQAIVGRIEELADEALRLPNIAACCLAAARRWNRINDSMDDISQHIGSVDDAGLLRRFGLELASAADAWIRETDCGFFERQGVQKSESPREWRCRCGARFVGLIASCPACGTGAGVEPVETSTFDQPRTKRDGFCREHGWSGPSPCVHCKREEGTE